MTRRLLAFVSIAALAAALFVRLGFWQLSRLKERRERNRPLQARLSQPVLEWRALASDSAARYRRARLRGTPDTAHELVLAARSYQGSPGIYLLTPMRSSSTDTAVLVNRGWVYAPDGMTVDRARWREADTLYEGFADIMPESNAAGTATAATQRPGVLTRLDRASVARALPYPVASAYLVATIPDSTKPASERVARLSPPTLDDGPHLGYAFQWFSFAVIALVGAGAVVLRSRGEEV